MSAREAIQKEVEENYAAFEALLPAIDPAQAGKYALLREGEIVEYFDSIGDGLKYAAAVFGDEKYSLQQVSDVIVDLGYFSHAGNI